MQRAASEQTRDMGAATAVDARPQAGVRAGPATAATSRSAILASSAPLLLPLLLVLAGSLVGALFTLDARVANERLIGLLLGGLAGLAALWGLRRLPDSQLAAVCAGAAGAALLGGLWVIALAGPAVFRGPLAGPLQVLAEPLFDVLSLTDDVALTNTRFIVGYNGLASLCLVAVFAASAALLTRPGRRVRLPAGALLLVAVVLLVASGSRGALGGLLLGIAAIVIFASRRALWLALGGSILAVLLAATGVLDRGLDVSSVTGRFIYWNDLARLLAEYPWTGVGLGVNTANAVVVAHEINPDPERVAYAHNTFVQAYLEQGPLGLLGMLFVPLLALLAAILARRELLSRPRRALAIGGLGLTVALQGHGLTDQVLTTNVGTALALLALAAVLAALSPLRTMILARWTRWLALGTGAVLVVALGLTLALPAGRAQALLNLGGLQLNQALLADSQHDRRGLEAAEATLLQALAHDPGHPAVLRQLARARLARFETAGALEALSSASTSPRLDAFDLLQIAHVYRDLGFGNQAYQLQARAYQLWGHVTPNTVALAYARATLREDPRVNTLVDQAEAAMHARDFAAAQTLFQQALTFQPDSAYLQDRLAAAGRGLASS